MIRRLLLLTVLIGSACSDELTADRAAETLDLHIGAIPPPAIGWDSVDIQVTQILQLSETERTVHFRLATQDDTVSNDATIYTAGFQRSSDGWSIANYGSGLSEMVAVFLAARELEVYKDLTAVLDSARILLLDAMVEEGDPFLDFFAGPGIELGSRYLSPLNSDSVEVRYIPGETFKSAVVEVISRRDTLAQCGGVWNPRNAHPEVAPIRPGIPRRGFRCGGRGPVISGDADAQIEAARQKIAAEGVVLNP